MEKIYILESYVVGQRGSERENFRGTEEEMRDYINDMNRSSLVGMLLLEDENYIPKKNEGDKRIKYTIYEEVDGETYLHLPQNSFPSMMSEWEVMEQFMKSGEANTEQKRRWKQLILNQK